jgi:hypothetical protein
MASRRGDIDTADKTMHNYTKKQVFGIIFLCLTNPLSDS